MKRFSKIILALGIWLLASGSLYTQNLVPNPSFETYTTCPTGSGQIYHAPPWTGPTVNSTDYYNVCSSIMGIPYAGVGYQYARTGNAYAGFWGYDGIGSNFREYLQAMLTDTLIGGKCYYIKFYTNLLNGNSMNQISAINNIAAHISNVAYSTSSTSTSNNVLNLTPHALKFGNPIIRDTLNWIEVSGIYEAIGGEDHIIIGNFKDDAHTDTSGNYYPSFTGYCYYYVEDVSLVLVDSLILPPRAGNDTSIVLGDSAFIGQELYGLNCNWYSNSILIDTNISGIWVKPNSVGSYSYVVEQNLCGSVTYDTVIVNVIAVGVRDFQDEKYADVSIYPNPNPGNELFLNLINMAKGSVLVKLTDVEGRSIVENSCIAVGGLSNFKMPEIDNGIYFVNITNLKTGERVVKKLVIQY